MDLKLLESERLFLRPLSYDELLQINDCRNACEAYIEPEAITGSVRFAIRKKIEKMQCVREDMHEWYTYWLIIHKDSGKGIGVIGFKGLKENGFAEVGYSISPDYRRKGLMTEALKALTGCARGFPDAKGITATVLKTNTGSVKVLNNCDFQLTGSFRQEDNYILYLR